ncbi:MAG: thioredoxin [Symploca sp. SIO1B1]|nr:thioredoxin [Symploca sp. SIO1C2]NER47085.1 thioredoxin [Symploca sp. SIO1A3]NER97630.1 thioredoxin [Symploca sp. SIO1B1]
MSSIIFIEDTEFENEVLKAQQLVLVYFWAPWCGPCKLVSPSVESIADTYSDRLKVIKMEVDPNPESRAICKVEGVPALRLFNNGELIESLEGAIGKPKLQAMLEAHL